jgi:hypothetical protein
MAGMNSFNHTAMRIGLILLASIFLSVSTGALANKQNSEKPADWRKRLEMLRSVPYVDISETVGEEEVSGVTLYDPEKAYSGYNLYSSLSSGEVFLLDMEGRVVHRWTYPRLRGNFSRHAVMLETGDLIVVKLMGLLRINWDSELIWRRTLAVHHDVAPAPDGSFYVIVQEAKTHRDLSVFFDTLVHMTADGEEINKWSTYDHLDDIMSALDTRSFLDTVLDDVLAEQTKEHEELEEANNEIVGYYKRDYFHMNTVNLLPATPLGRKDSRFQSDNLLVCFRNVNQIAILEKGTYRVLWAWGEGQLEWPHQPTMLQNGHILIFDNGIKRKYSRVVELNPVTEAIIWEYKAEIPEDFYSYDRGSAQRLPNGNTLICESNKGQVFEVTVDGEMVWKWLSPMVGEKNRETVYRMTRLPEKQVDRLLKR